MYEQDMIIGPLTIRQFIVLVVGFGLSYLLYKQLPQYESLQVYIYIIIAFIAATSLYVAFSIFKNPKIPLDKVAEHFKQRKLKMLPIEYERMIIKKIIIIGSQIQRRKAEGLPADESLSKMYDIVLSEYDIINPTAIKKP